MNKFTFELARVLLMVLAATISGTLIVYLQKTMA